MNLAYTHRGQEIILTLESGNIFWNPCTPIHYKNFMISKLIFVCVCVCQALYEGGTAAPWCHLPRLEEILQPLRDAAVPLLGLLRPGQSCRLRAHRHQGTPGIVFFLRFKAYILIFLKRFIKKIGYSIGLSSITEVDQHIYRTLKIISIFFSIIDMYMCTYV